MHPIYADPTDRAQLWALLEATWPGLPARFDLADWHGWPIDAVSTPFVTRVDDRIVSHVGVLDLAVRLGGQDRRIAGLHGACTMPDVRRQGHFGAAMERAMVYIRERFSTAKLSTDKPWAYEPFGFRSVPQHRARVALSGAGGPGCRPVIEADLPWMNRLLEDRAPMSDRFAALDHAWLLGIDGVLWSGGLGIFQAIEALDVVVAWEIEGRSLQVYQVVARDLPSLEQLLLHCPWSFDEVVLWFGADLLAPGAEPVAFPQDEHLMVWGDWPEQGPFCVPPLEAH